jgi:hypothetical protein
MDKEKTKRYVDQYYLDHHETILLRHRKWNKDNAQKLRRRRQSRQHFINGIKEITGCQYCGKMNLPFRELYFHHRTGNKDKKFGIGPANHSWQKLIEEIEKCDILCASCHSTLHYRLGNES